MTDIEMYLSEAAEFTIPARDVLQQYGNAAHALLYYTVFFPTFTEVDGSIIIIDNIHDAANRFRAARAESKMSLACLEASFNSVEVAYVFKSGDQLSKSVEIELCRKMKIAWTIKLSHDYPSRVFSVTIVDPPDSGSVYCVQFFEVR